VRIAYLGRESGTSLDRGNALSRLGHAVDLIDIRAMLPASVWVDRVTYHMGGGCFAPWVRAALEKRFGVARYDLCWVDNGEFVTPPILRMLRKHAPKIINYSIDDPLGMRDPRKFRAYRQCVPLYDLCVVMRAFNVAEAYARGARDVMRVYMTADEVMHSPRTLSEDDRKKWCDEVLFVGTWFPERGPFLLELAQRGVPLSIRGSNWFKAPEWKLLQRYWRGGPLKGDDYARAIQCAKINLGLLSKGNRDLHTTRSAEIPALGGLFCGERTEEHTGLYVEDVEAVFWKDVAECAHKCQSTLADERRRESMAQAGHRRVAANRQYNEPVLRSILDRAMRQEVAVA
jgi:spore maturation protein CgeB